jgi:hypothetical protein
VARGRTGWKLGTESFLDDEKHEVRLEVAETLRSILVDGALPRVSPETFAPCLTLSEEPLGGSSPGTDAVPAFRIEAGTEASACEIL